MGCAIPGSIWEAKPRSVLSHQPADKGSQQIALQA